MRRPSTPVLDDISRTTRLRTFAALCVALGLLFGAQRLMAADNLWIHEGDISNLVDSNDAENYVAPLASCGLTASVPTGFDPAWIRVGGSTNPHAPIVMAKGQVLDPHDYVTFVEGTILGGDAKKASTKTNAFVNYTDAPFNHYARDVNTFLTLDPEYRHLLSTGSFEEGDSNERGNFEIEWERGGIPMYAFPAIGDRMQVWGTHVFDCGHGDTWIEDRDTGDNYRTEIHAPFGWVIYRQTADADGQPDGDKATRFPWQWYDDTDLPGMAVSLPTSGLLNTLVQATVADVYFSSFGGNVVESINGCDEDDDAVPCYGPEFDGDIVRPELNGDQSTIHSWEWHQPILDQDYEFVVPAPPLPPGAAADTRMIFEVEDRCSDVPKNPTIPNKDDHTEALEEVEGITFLGGGTAYAKNWPIGAARCNHAPNGQAPYTVEMDLSTGPFFLPWNDTGRPAIRVIVRAKTGADGIDGSLDDPTYPSNDYISFAYRVKVAWDYAPASANRAQAFRADFDTLEVYNNGEECYFGAEWIITLRVNDQTIHPVQGSAPDDIDGDDVSEPFWEDDVIEDNRSSCLGESGVHTEYEMGSNNAQYLTRYFAALPDVPIEVYDRTYEKDHLSYDDLAPVYRDFYPQPYLPGEAVYHTIGENNSNVDVGHRIAFYLTNISNPVPANGPLEIGTPNFGPVIATSFLMRVKGTTPITLTAPAGITAFQWRAWPQTLPATAPGPWQYDSDPSDGLTVDLPDTGSATYTIEWATISDASIVSERSRLDVELDNVPPTLSLPADFSVFANSTAGATVTYEATAVDDLPGPVTVVCTPETGAVFPNGANGPKATTVSCTATDAVTNESSGSFNVTVTSPHGYINDYALMGIDWLDAAQGGSTIGGGVGVFQQSTGISGQPGLELRLGNDGIVTPTANVAAHSVRIGAGAKIGDLFSVTAPITGAGSVYTLRSACGAGPASGVECAYVPLWPQLPPFVQAAPPGADKQISGNVTLVPANYGELVLKSKAVVTLGPGTYSFSRIELGPNSKISYTSANTVVRVAGRVEFKSGVGVILPTPGAPAHLKLYVGGADLAANRPAVDIFAGSTIAANVYVPNGTLAVGNTSILTGAFIAKRLLLGSNVRVTKDSVFVQ